MSQGGSGQGGAASGGAGASEDAAAVSLANRSRTLTDPRNSTGYVGLYNLGCICYMNSTMQQFFMNPAFRKGVLSWAEPAHSSAGEHQAKLRAHGTHAQPHARADAAAAAATTT